MTSYNLTEINITIEMHNSTNKILDNDLTQF